MNDYGVDQLTVLEGLDAVRVRPGMYIGSTGPDGLAHLLWELVDNAVDEASEGHGSQVDVTAHVDGSWEVCDQGRGIPVEVMDDGRSGIEVVFTELHAGGKFGQGAYSASGGLHGVGASVVNALSDRVEVTVRREGREHQLVFVERVSGVVDGRGKHKPGVGPSTKRVSAKKSGTSVRFWPDLSVFGEGTVIEVEAVRDRLRQACWAVPGLRITLTVDGVEEVFGPHKSLAEYVDTHLGGKQVAKTITFEGSVDYEVKAVGVDGKARTVKRVCEVDVALGWGDGDGDLRLAAWVNSIPTPDGGSHVSGVQRGLLSAVNQVLRTEKPRKLRRLEGKRLVQDEIGLGMVAAVRVRTPEPEFSGQTKRQLGLPQLEDLLRAVTVTEVEKHLKGLPSRVRTRLVDHFAERMLVTDAAVRAAAARRKQKKVDAAALPAKLADCRYHISDRSYPDGLPGAELLIVEGDSAAGPAKRARDQRWQAVLPLRGKVVNAVRSKPMQVMGNAEALALIAALGAGSRAGFDVDAARYERLVLLCDADVDGSHIRSLLLGLLWVVARPMLESGRVYAAVPPSHAVQVGSKKKYVFGEDGIAKAVRSLTRKSDAAVITRFKGLGEMSDDELYETALNPDSRTLRRVSVVDGARSAEAFEVMLGADVSVRRDFIVEHSSAYGHALDF